MRIEPRFAATAAAAAQAHRPAGTTRFALGAPSRREAARAGAAAPLATLDAILMLQGEEDPGERRRRQAKHGQTLLDGLDRLKAGLLTGTIPQRDLDALGRQLAASAGASGDPTLDEAIGAIELRVRVELAKLGRV